MAEPCVVDRSRTCYDSLSIKMGFRCGFIAVRLSSSSWVPVLSLLVASLLWGSSFVVFKYTFGVYDRWVVVFGRLAVASLCFVFMPGVFRNVRFRWADLPALLFMALCEPCFYYLFEARALTNTTASQAAMITAILPFLVALAARGILRESFSPRMLTGFCLATLGAVLLSVSADVLEDAPHPALGNFQEFLAMVCATGYIVSARHLSARYGPLFLTAVQTCVGALFFLPFLFLPSTVLPVALSPVAVLAIAYLGIFVSLAAYALYNFGVSRLTAGRAAAFINLIPAFALLLGWVALGERLNAVQWLAAAVIFFGVWLSQDRRARD